MKRVVISCGPIPARLDSVKFITNRFRGGLAFRTARELAREQDMEVTIVKWSHTSLPWTVEEMVNMGIHDLVDVVDVVEYAKWFEDHAKDYDAFVMAAAVANLMPSEPYETKFPSHLYRVGEQFDIRFEIAPRAIDIIKRVNPRCCLIGYKLFDAATDEELINIARHTLEDAKANVVFANSPKDAKSKKIAVTADGAAIPMDFEEHVAFMKKAIRAEYFKTIDGGKVQDNDKLTAAIHLVDVFEKTFPHFGTVAFRVPGVGMVTTSRGHSGAPVVVTDVDLNNRTVTCAGGRKATLNAPLLWRMLELNRDADYIVHRHFDDPMAEKMAYGWRDFKELDYEFPGTVGEASAYGHMHCGISIRHHGYLALCTMKDVDWGRYYEIFPERYFGTRDAIEEVLRYAESHPDIESLEVGGNSTCRCKYNLDPNMRGRGVISYDDLDNMEFDVVVARNSINYLSADELMKVMKSLKPDGVFIANGFAKAPEFRIRKYDDGKAEVVVCHYDGRKETDVVDHFLILDDTICRHTFYARGASDYEMFGFDVERDGSSILIRKGHI